MNENVSPHEPAGCDPAEARIVAWVHGEVAAGEVAELERLCAERPELADFRRRMLALHGLLAAPAGDDAAWKLSPQRRTRVEAALATPLATSVRPSHRWARPVLMAAAACLMLAAGFHFIVSPIGKPSFVRESPDELPVVTAAPRADKSVGSFHHDGSMLAGEGVKAGPLDLPGPPASAPIAPLDRRPADDLAGNFAKEGAFHPPAAPSVPAAAKRPATAAMAGVAEEAASLADAGREKPPVARAMTAPALAPADAQAPSTREAVERKWRTSEALRKYGVVVDAVPGGWSFSRTATAGREELFRAHVSDAAGARVYRVTDELRVKLLATDAAGAECAEKMIELGGRKLSVEALLRETLEK